MKEILSIRGLSKSYKNIQAIQNLNLNISEGQAYGILGPNGSGKTTTLAGIIEKINQELDVVISIDTSKALVMTEAAAAGAGLINDVMALRADGALDAASQTGLPVCLMHMQGEPRSMQMEPLYDNVVTEVSAFLNARAEQCIAAGMNKNQIIIDPGFGFGKN